MTIKIRINEASKKILINLCKTKQFTKRAIRQSYYDLGKELVKESKRLILDPPKTGRVYRIKRNVRVTRHQASAPGEAPANLRGNLRRSINFIVHGDGKMEFGSEDKTDKNVPVPYGKALEKGHAFTSRRKILPRPYLITSIRSNMRNAQTYFKHHYKRLVK